MWEGLTILAQWLAGFSVVASVILLRLFFTENFHQQPQAQWHGSVLVMGLGFLQACHALSFSGHNTSWHEHPLYLTALLLIGPNFQQLVQALIWQPVQRQTVILHSLPALVLPWLWPSGAFTTAFGLGTAYLAYLIFKLKKFYPERKNHPYEITWLSAVWISGMGVVIYGLSFHSQPSSYFFTFYSMGIGLILFLILTSLLIYPLLTTTIQETAQAAAYTQSTLKNLDTQALLVQLKHLMEQEKLYTDPQLQLSSLAHHLNISGHQLSELINTQLGKGFSRYLREQRIAAAKDMLLLEPRASILAVGLNVGFTSSSNLYEAFRDLEGMTPGQFRKLHLKRSE